MSSTRGRLTYRERFARGCELTMCEDDEERTCEAVLVRPGLSTRSGRVPKDMLYDGARAILRCLGVG